MFGERLKQLRTEKDISQDQLSNVLGVTRQAISSYEVNNRQPDFDILVKISDYFGVSVDYLLCKTNIRVPHNFNAFETNPAAVNIINILYEIINTLNIKQLHLIDMLELNTKYKNKINILIDEIFKPYLK